MVQHDFTLLTDAVMAVVPLAETVVCCALSESSADEVVFILLFSFFMQEVAAKIIALMRADDKMIFVFI